MKELRRLDENGQSLLERVIITPILSFASPTPNTWPGGRAGNRSISYHDNNRNIFLHSIGNYDTAFLSTASIWPEQRSESVLVRISCVQCLFGRQQSPGYDLEEVKSVSAHAKSIPMYILIIVAITFCSAFMIASLHHSSQCGWTRHRWLT